MRSDSALSWVIRTSEYHGKGDASHSEEGSELGCVLRVRHVCLIRGTVDHADGGERDDRDEVVMELRCRVCKVRGDGWTRSGGSSGRL